MVKTIGSCVRRLLNSVNSIAFVLHFPQVRTEGKSLQSLVIILYFVAPCMKRNKLISTPEAGIFLSILYNGSTAGYTRTIRRILLREIQVRCHGTEHCS